MKIKVCIGSSCHLKGSYDVIGEFKKLIAENKSTDKVELEGVFCLGKCGNAVSVQIDDEFYNLKPQECESFFNEKVKPNI